MPKKNEETDLQYKHRVIDIKSESFCAAKWYNATIWLGSGMTTSCHHPLPHPIDIEAIKTNPSALHNTDKKKQEREQMQKGERPSGCEYCWKVEDMGTDAISDRVYKTVIYEDKENDEAFNTPCQEDVNLKTLEIAFDRTCQLACSYCNPAFSSTWVKDVKRNGAYIDLVSDGRNHFTHTHDSSQLYTFSETNPYIEAFFKWWETDLHKTLNELRITGGEPLMSGHTWKLIEWFKTNQGRSKTKLAINSNLAISQEKLAEFIDSIQSLPHLEVYTSNESVGAQSEYIRDGIDYTQWCTNVETLMKTPSVKIMHVMFTINSLCLDSICDLLDYLVTLKHQHGKFSLSFSLNILRFPSFQSATVLPDEIRSQYKEKLQTWLDLNKDDVTLHEYEVRHVERLIDYLDIVKTPHQGADEVTTLQNDFKQFYKQYDERRGKNFTETFPQLTEWYNTL
jgi:organic radical activating enzyme